MLVSYIIYLVIKRSEENPCVNIGNIRPSAKKAGSRLMAALKYLERSTESASLPVCALPDLQKITFSTRIGTNMF